MHLSTVSQTSDLDYVPPLTGDLDHELHRRAPRPPPGKPSLPRENIPNQLPDGRWNTYNGQEANARFNVIGQRILPGGEGGARFIPPEEYKEFLQLGHGGIFDLDLDNIDVAPWRKRGIDPDAYFNYGFTERTWRRYVNEIRKARLELHLRNAIETPTSDYQSLDSELPVEVRRALGGWEYATDPQKIRPQLTTSLREGHPLHSQRVNATNEDLNTNVRAQDKLTEHDFQTGSDVQRSGFAEENISLSELSERAQKIQAEYISLRASNALTPSKSYTLQQQMLEVKTKIAKIQTNPSVL